MDVTLEWANSAGFDSNCGNGSHILTWRQRCESNIMKYHSLVVICISNRYVIDYFIVFDWCLCRLSSFHLLIDHDTSRLLTSIDCCRSITLLFPRKSAVGGDDTLQKSTLVTPSDCSKRVSPEHKFTSLSFIHCALLCRPDRASQLQQCVI